MSKVKRKLSVLIAVLVMVSMTGTSVLAYDDSQAAGDPADAAVTQEEGNTVPDEDLNGADEGTLAEGTETESEETVENPAEELTTENTTITVPVQKYTGKAVNLTAEKLTVNYTPEGATEPTTLEPETDYVVKECTNNVAVTKEAVVTIEGKEEFRGTVSGKFEIAAVAPDPVKKLTVLPGNGCFKLKWTKVDDVDYYYIERRIAGKKKVNRTRKTDASETKSCTWENAYKIDTSKKYQFTIYAVKNGKKSAGTKSAKVKTVQRLVISVVLKQNVGKLKAGKRYKTLGFGGGKFRIKKGKKTYYVSRLKTKNRKASYKKNGAYSREAVEFFMNGGTTWAKGMGYIKKKKVKTTKYMVWVNTYNQHVYVLKKGSNGKYDCIDDWKCSMGKKDTPSPTGHKTIIRYEAKHSGHNAPYWNFISYKKSYHHGTALHGLETSGGKTKTSWINNLGKLASHGCIRNPSDKAKALHDEYGGVGNRVIIY